MRKFVSLKTTEVLPFRKTKVVRKFEYIASFRPCALKTTMGCTGFVLMTWQLAKWLSKQNSARVDIMYLVID